jgi:hypothetical protein
MISLLWLFYISVIYFHIWLYFEIKKLRLANPESLCLLCLCLLCLCLLCLCLLCLYRITIFKSQNKAFSEFLIHFFIYLLICQIMISFFGLIFSFLKLLIYLFLFFLYIIFNLKNKGAYIYFFRITRMSL